MATSDEILDEIVTEGVVAPTEAQLAYMNNLLWNLELWGFTREELRRVCEESARYGQTEREKVSKGISMLKVLWTLLEDQSRTAVMVTRMNLRNPRDWHPILGRWVR